MSLQCSLFGSRSNSDTMVRLFLLAALIASSSSFSIPSRTVSRVSPKVHLANPTDSAEGRSERLSLDISETIYTSSMKSPKDAYLAFAEKGASNAKMQKRKILHQSILGGCYVGFGGLLSLSIAGGLGGIGAANPGIPKMAFAALFPVNLLLIVTTSAQVSRLLCSCEMEDPVKLRPMSSPVSPFFDFSSSSSLATLPPLPPPNSRIWSLGENLQRVGLSPSSVMSSAVVCLLSRLGTPDSYRAELPAFVPRRRSTSVAAPWAKPSSRRFCVTGWSVSLSS